MNGVILVTDHDWFQFLTRQPGLEEVNFWRPSDTRTPRSLREGTPVLFKLRKQFGGWIVGWGLFARHDLLPAWLAWDTFEERNGAASFEQMRTRIEHLRHSRSAAKDATGSFTIGCLMLAQPVFLPREAWIHPPTDWPDNVVQGKAYDLASGEGARIWRLCQELAPADRFPEAIADPLVRDLPRYGNSVLTRPRLGQGIFRIAVTDAYGRACAVTGEHSLPALEAAHIRPYGEGGQHAVRNGLLLRSDIHRLFDKGYVGVSPDFRFIVSDRLKADFSNGKSYYPLHDKLIQLPGRVADRPDPAQLEWHSSSIFR